MQKENLGAYYGKPCFFFPQFYDLKNLLKNSKKKTKLVELTLQKKIPNICVKKWKILLTKTT